MKRNWFVTVFLVVICAATAYTWPNAKMMEKLPGSALGWDDTNGIWRPMNVNSDGKLVTDAAVTIGSVSVTPGTPPTKNQTDVFTLTPSTPYDITSLTNRNSIAIFNHSDTETLWASLDSDAASAAVGICIPIRPYGSLSVPLDSAKNVSVIASTAFDVTAYQDGY